MWCPRQEGDCGREPTPSQIHGGPLRPSEMLLPMATFDGVDLAAEAGSGGIFEIANARPRPPYLYEVPGGGQVVVPESGAVAIVRGISSSGYFETLSAAREAANKGLDMSLSDGGAPVLLDHHRQPQVVWWRAGEHTVLKVVSTTPFTMRMSAHLTVRDRDGDEVLQPPAPEREWHESLRFYRVSEASGDLFDSFRNLYLAIEALLSDIHPPRIEKTGHLEREGDWLARALREVRGTVDLGLYAPATARAAHNAIHDELYSGLRTAIFHAKRGKDVWLPQDWKDRAVIREARHRYAGLFRQLAERHLVGIRFPGSGLSKHGFAAAAEAFMEGVLVFVSDDPTRLADEPEGQYGIAPAGGRVLLLTSRRAVEMQDDFTAGVVGFGAGTKIMAEVDGIRRFGTLLDGELAIVENLAGSLDVAGVDDVDVVLLLANRNHGAPRLDFDT